MLICFVECRHQKPLHSLRRGLEKHHYAVLEQGRNEDARSGKKKIREREEKKVLGEVKKYLGGDNEWRERCDCGKNTFEVL